MAAGDGFALFGRLTLGWIGKHKERTMKNALIFSILAAGLAAGGVAWAGPGGHRGGHFDRLDENGDGALTRDELDARQREFFDAADADRDGRLTQDEMRAHHEKKRAERRGKRLGDANGDGKVSKAEYEAAAEERFRKLDKNKDGFISDAEMEEAREKRRSRS